VRFDTTGQHCTAAEQVTSGGSEMAVVVVEFTIVPTLNLRHGR
jgi:hypothetical protein